MDWKKNQVGQRVDMGKVYKCHTTGTELILQPTRNTADNGARNNVSSAQHCCSYIYMSTAKRLTQEKGRRS